MMENPSMNNIDVNSDKDTSNLENLRALFATLEKKEKEKQMLKVENQSLKQELKESQNEKQMLKVENQSLKQELKESQKDNERLLQELANVKSENQTKNLALNELQADKENLQKNMQNLQNESDTQIESLKIELVEVKQAIQSFLSAENRIKSLSKMVETSATPEMVPKQSEKVQRAQISHSNDEEEQINDQMSDQQAVQIPDGQLQTTSEDQEQQQQPMEVTQHERITAPSMDTFPTQVLSQSVQISY